MIIDRFNGATRLINEGRREPHHLNGNGEVGGRIPVGSEFGTLWVEGRTDLGDRSSVSGIVRDIVDGCACGVSDTRHATGWIRRHRSNATEAFRLLNGRGIETIGQIGSAHVDLTDAVDDGTLPEAESVGTAVNNFGVSTGWLRTQVKGSGNQRCRKRGWVWLNDPSVLKPIRWRFSDDLDTVPAHINSGNMAVGVAQRTVSDTVRSEFGFHAEASGGEWSASALPAYLYDRCVASASNDDGAIVGSGWPAGTDVTKKVNARAMLWDDPGDGPWNLDTMIDASWGLTLHHAVDINQMGEILCAATDEQGFDLPVVLSPR